MLCTYPFRLDAFQEHIPSSDPSCIQAPFESKKEYNTCVDNICQSYENCNNCKYDCKCASSPTPTTQATGTPVPGESPSGSPSQEIAGVPAQGFWGFLEEKRQEIIIISSAIGAVIAGSLIWWWFLILKKKAATKAASKAANHIKGKNYK